MKRSQEYLTFPNILDMALQSEGLQCLPNVKEIEDPLDALQALSSASNKPAPVPYRFRIREFDPPLPSGQKHETAYYPKIFLNTKGMSGRFDGSGVILANIGNKARAFSFHMCEHEWDESGANHSRGWHPKVCKKCGFDASIDSGD